MGAAGTTGTAGAGGVGGRGGTTGTGGMSGATGRGGTTGTAGTSGATGRGGTTGTAGTSGNAGRGGTTGTAGAGGNAGRGGTTGTAGTSGNAGRGGTTGTAGAGGTRPPPCAAPADCSGSLTGLTFCSSPSWSCVEGVCVAECRGGRTCREAPDAGCLYCATSSAPQASEGCVTTACAFQPARIRDVQQSNGCQPPNTPDFDTWHCTGNWAVLPGSDRPICTIQMLGTDAVRYSISCGSCITIVTL